MKNKNRIKLIYDSCGDLPKGIIGLYGTILKRVPKEDEKSLYGTLVNRAYLVKLDKRVETFTLYEKDMFEETLESKLKDRIVKSLELQSHPSPKEGAERLLDYYLDQLADKLLNEVIDPVKDQLRNQRGRGK